jgi:hypothetical protein
MDEKEEENRRGIKRKRKIREKEEEIRGRGDKRKRR